MKYLLDTHILLWAIRNAPNLTEKVKRIITDPANEIYVSVASEWEVAIKTNIGKLKLKPNFAAFIKPPARSNWRRSLFL